ncbi:rho GTPase-activating protein 11A isoform X2 [Coregonus clupeaformis]|uniref:rho GTPase-activating protein 11A isoform X2 n=1 Tax=Coregonus clupeaformis TaxID=59861 RepID=UPI001E1C3799|nr:rho GTPase-activating protein 11A isoform X2 [Coregonus clupeaformis]
MKIMERNVMRLAVVQHLRTAYGIKTKNWNKNKTRTSFKLTANHSVKVFGVPLESLLQYNVENGSIPCFLMDACASLLEHLDTEGLFRKSGSIVRLKALQVKLDKGEECLSTALPCDVAGLVKQFFRELPDPVMPTELHDAFLKAQQLHTKEDRTYATLLLSCVLPDRNMSILRYFFGFLNKVSQRSAVNKMDSSNLSVILAPNLLHTGDGADKINASTEKRLKQQAAVVHCLIEHASDFGVVPQLIMEKIPAMLGCEAGVLSPTLDRLEDLDTNSGAKRRCRRSLGVFSSATHVIITPISKREIPLESGHSYGFSNKRRSIKNDLALELLPNALFGGSSTPGSGYLDPSASESLVSSQNALSSVGRSSRQSASSARRKSKRLSHRHFVNRVESGKAGCFSPKVTKKENVRKSLRLRFSLGKSSRDPRKGSESIGWRLATQERTTSFCFTKEAKFSPAVLRNKSASKGSKFYSKSEDNLLTPQCDGSALRTSWSGETPDEGHVFSGGYFTDTPINMCLKNNYYSEPAIMVAKPPMVASFPKKLCCASRAESLESEGSFSQTLTGPTLLKIKRAFTESGSDLQGVLRDYSSPSEEVKATQPEHTQTDSTPSEYSTLKSVSPNKESSGMPTPWSHLADDQNITFGQIEFVPLSPLYIDSALFEVGGCGSLSEKACDWSLCAGDRSVEGEAETVAEQVNCSRVIDALDIQSPAHFTRKLAAGVQSTPYRVSGLEYFQELKTPLPPVGAVPVMVHDDDAVASPDPSSHPQRQEQQQVEQPSPGTLETRRLRVVDHIQRFNKLTLYSPKSQAKAVRSPLKFQRTPVRQSIRRINSLLGDRRPVPTRITSSSQGTPIPVGKAVSLESGLSAGAQCQPHQGEADNQGGPTLDKVRSTNTRPPPVPPKKPASIARKPRNCALGDVTNKVQPKAKGDTPVKKGPGGKGQPSVVQQVAEKDVCRYRGSPRNPLNEGRLLSATKPIDL